MTSTWTFAVSVGLLVYTVLGVQVYRRHRQPGLAAVMFMAAFWTVLGAFTVIRANDGAPSNAFSYLEFRTYPVLLNYAYAQTLVLYFLFLILFLAILLLLKPESTQEKVNTVSTLRAILSYFPLFLAIVGAVGGLALQLLIVQRLTGRLGIDTLYDASSNPNVSRAVLRLNSYINLATSSLIAVISVASVVRASMRNFKPKSIVAIFAALALIGVQYRINVVLGTRSATMILALAVLVGLAAYGFTTTRGTVSVRAKWLLGFLGFVALYFIVAIGLARTNANYGAQGQASLAANLLNPGLVMEELLGAGAEGELLPAHFSLYHALNAGLDVGGLIPYWDSSYASYANQLLLPADQGFTIHLVAGWWLVAGPFAPLMAALQLGVLTWFFLWIARRGITRWSVGWIFAATTWAMVSMPVTSLRSGPEGLRGTLTAALLVPYVSTVVLWIIAFNRWEKGELLEPEGKGAPTNRSERPSEPLPIGRRSAH